MCGKNNLTLALHPARCRGQGQGSIHDSNDADLDVRCSVDRDVVLRNLVKDAD